MSKERELLKKWLIECMWRGSNMSLLEETKELLAQPEQDLIGYVADNSVGFDVSRSVQGMPLIWLGKLNYGDKLYRVGVTNE